MSYNSGVRSKTKKKPTERARQVVGAQDTRLKASGAIAEKTTVVAKTSKNGAMTRGQSSQSLRLVRGLAAVLDEFSLSEVAVDFEGVAVKLRREPLGSDRSTLSAPVVAHSPANGAAPSAEMPPVPSTNEERHVVTSPFVGTFYGAPGPEAPPYVAAGQRVDKGQVLCIVEAMKLMNEIEADRAGVICSVLVENAEAVEYGQALFEIALA